MVLWHFLNEIWVTFFIKIYFLEKIAWLFVLFYFELAANFIQSAKFNEQNLPSNSFLNPMISIKALDSFNELFEGILLSKKNTIITSNILPQSFSNVFIKKAKSTGIVNSNDQVIFF